MDKAQIFEKLEKIHNLPTLPAIIDKLGQAIRNPESEARQIARIIEDDPSMMARILKVVNSAFYGVSEPIHSVQHAVARMGLVAVYNIAMSTAVFSAFGRKGETDFNREEFWRHSISCGIACNVLYERAKGRVPIRYTKDVLHLSGLLHDIGKIIFEQFFHLEFMNSIRQCHAKGISLYQAEVESLGVDHTEIGAWLGKRWNISDEIVSTIRYHHTTEQANPDHINLVNLCHIANYICNLEKIGNSGDLSSPVFSHNVWKQLGLSVPDIAEIVDEVKEESKKSEILLAFVS